MTPKESKNLVAFLSITGLLVAMIAASLLVFVPDLVDKRFNKAWNETVNQHIDSVVDDGEVANKLIIDAASQYNVTYTNASGNLVAVDIRLEKMPTEKILGSCDGIKMYHISSTTSFEFMRSTAYTWSELFACIGARAGWDDETVEDLTWLTVDMINASRN